MKDETMEFDIYIITHIICVLVTLKLIISGVSSAYIAHISAPTGFKCWHI